MKQKLTDAPKSRDAISKMQPKDKPYRVSDGGGLYLQIEPGGSKHWRYAYRFDGKQKTLALGSYPDVSLSDARTKHLEARKLRASGIDPGEKKKEQQRAEQAAAVNSFEAVARVYAAKQANRWSKKHAANFVRRLEVDMFPVLGSKAISKIDRHDVLTALEAVEERGAYDLAHRLLQMTKAVFRYAVGKEHCQSDPIHNVKPSEVLTPHKSENMKSVKSKELPELLAKIDGYDGERQTQLGLQFLYYTFCRTNELIGMQWDEINLKEKRWEIPAERMKMRREHFVPLSAQALTILEELNELNGDYKYVFAGRNPRVPMSNNTLLYALYRLGYRGRMTGHGFRSLASTILNEAYDPATQGRRFHRDWIEMQLSHEEPNQVRGSYNKAEYLPDRTKMMQWWADHIDSLRIVAPTKEPPAAKSDPNKVIVVTTPKRARRGIGSSLMLFAL